MAQQSGCCLKLWKIRLCFLPMLQTSFAAPCYHSVRHSTNYSLHTYSHVTPYTEAIALQNYLAYTRLSVPLCHRIARSLPSWTSYTNKYPRNHQVSGNHSSGHCTGISARGTDSGPSWILALSAKSNFPKPLS